MATQVTNTQEPKAEAEQAAGPGTKLKPTRQTPVSSGDGPKIRCDLCRLVFPYSDWRYSARKDRWHHLKCLVLAERKSKLGGGGGGGDDDDSCGEEAKETRMA
jgi:hypothetical protein